MQTCMTWVSNRQGLFVLLRASMTHWQGRYGVSRELKNHEMRYISIHEARDRKLETAREARSEIRSQQAAATDAKRSRPEHRAMLGSNIRQNHPCAESMPKAIAMGVDADVIRPASATCLWPQCDKSRGAGAEPPRRTTVVWSFKN